MKKVSFGLSPAGLNFGTTIRTLLDQATIYLVNLDINLKNHNIEKLH